MNLDRRHVEAIARREVVTVARTRASWFLTVGIAVVVSGLAVLGGGGASGYLPVVVDLSMPAEVLVPLLAFAFGYRVFLDDRRSGELAVHAIMPPSRVSVVTGVFLGRAVVLAVALALGFLPGFVAGALAGDAGGALYATQRGADSPLLYLRFVSLATLYGISSLALALAVSAAVRSTRAALAGVFGLGLMLLVGIDLGLFGAVVSGLVGTESLPVALAFSPNAAFRALVLTTVVDVATVSSGGLGVVLANVASLVAWTIVGVSGAVVTVWDD
ncbi:ABC transporter permease subunit [Haloferax sp. MBLA0076]|uniref:ABC transporter permease subunit n=1 Tax=Haloferax litoreum TaxID=2666140 RepID=A0A6A8GMH3_9EURY|nr:MULTISPECIES: ABC transporter permease subunit [Haloferax]KAB1190057.1 ABC transporter permease subunit [Haloferax sp. CBA1148]MRX23832.1 ABC transporter permease subunit [Haloferax litoreum]